MWTRGLLARAGGGMTGLERDDGLGEEGGEGGGVEGALDSVMAVRSGLGGGFSSSESSLGLKSKASSRSDSFKSA